jgi:hypothetical protein
MSLKMDKECVTLGHWLKKYKRHPERNTRRSAAGKQENAMVEWLEAHRTYFLRWCKAGMKVLK